MERLPWVRGRGLMLGVRLLELDACDALDLIHVFLEEDSTHVSEAHLNSKIRVRDIIYGDLYGQPTRHRSGSEDARTEAPGAPAAPAAPAAETKPYIPPTDPEKLATIVGAPME
jgi:hypothetical protein